MSSNVKFGLGAIILVLAFTGLNCSSGNSGSRDAAALPGTGSGSGTGYNINDYLNYAQGNYWTFASTSAYGIYKYECSGAQFIHGFDCWPVTLYIGSAGAGYRMEYPTTSSGNLEWVGLGNIGNDSDLVRRTPPTRYGLSSMTVGQTWTDDGEQSDSLTGANVTYSATGTLVAVESVSFDDGTLIDDNCLKIRHDNYVDGQLTTITRWYAPRSGMVRYEESSLALTLTDSNALR
ncbi:MAG: hypothetical protein ACYS8W_14795 [Planctomycetota bacterium]